MKSIIDAAQTLEPFAGELAQGGVNTVFRYYNHKNVSLKTKRLEKSEASALSDHGISLGVVFQQRAREIQDFAGEQGVRDATRALELAHNLGQPTDSAIYFAVDRDFVKTSSLETIAAYFEKIESAFSGAYKVGAYGSGKVLSFLRTRGLVEYCWLAQARGWSGYKSFLQSGDWTLMQQMPAVWPGAGFSYDANIINPGLSDFGQFMIGASTNAKITSGPPLIMQVNARSGLRLRSGPSVQFGIIDTLPFGTIVFAGKVEDGWARVDLEGDGLYDGYMHVSYLTTLSGGLPVASTGNSSPYQIALKELALGVAEIAGEKHNPRIVLYHASTDKGAADEVPWCSSFVNYCVEQAGYEGTKSKWAMSWENWGTDVSSNPSEGDIVVYKRSKKLANGKVRVGGHVGFFVEMAGNTIKLLGGNQGNAVSKANFPEKSGTRGSWKYELLSIRRA